MSQPEVKTQVREGEGGQSPAPSPELQVKKKSEKKKSMKTSKTSVVSSNQEKLIRDEVTASMERVLSRMKEVLDALVDSFEVADEVEKLLRPYIEAEKNLLTVRIIKLIEKINYNEQMINGEVR